MATTTATRANRATENKNAAANTAAASVEPAKATRSRIIVAGIPKPTETVKEAAAATSPATVQPAAPAKAEPTAEERAAALQREIEERTKALQAALTELTRKKELSDHRDKFLKTLDQLTATEQQLNEADDFDGNEPCKIAFQGKPDGYRWETIFSIGNTELQREFITFIRKKIRAKVEDIEAELIK